MIYQKGGSQNYGNFLLIIKLRKLPTITLLPMPSTNTPTAAAEEGVPSFPFLAVTSSTSPNVKVEIQITEEQEAALEQFKDAKEATKTSPLFVSDLKQKTGTQLLSISNAIRSEVDTSLLSQERVGTAPASFLDKIYVSDTEFKDPDEMFKIVTKYTNLHDTLIQNLDCSGQGLAEGTKETNSAAHFRFD